MEKPVKQQLLEMLMDLRDQELKLFHWYLENAELLGFPALRRSYLEAADRMETAYLMVAIYTPKYVMEVTHSILMKMGRNQGQSEREKHCFHPISIMICQINVLGKSQEQLLSSFLTFEGSRNKKRLSFFLLIFSAQSFSSSMKCL